MNKITEIKKLILVMLSAIMILIMVLVGMMGVHLKNQMGESDYRTKAEIKPTSIFY
ncbi:hypothetical protein [Echinicola sediminis]